MTLLEKAHENYNKVLEYQRQTNYDTRLDDLIWSQNMRDLNDIFASSKSAEDALDKIDRTFMYAINFPPENGRNSGVWREDVPDNPVIREKQIDWLLNKLTFDLDIIDIQESPYIHSRNKVSRLNKVLSGNFLRTLSISQEVFKHLGKPASIFELGAGCGHQARTFLLQLPDCKYTIVDLPETLFFSFIHLSLTFPDKKILYVTSPEQEIDGYDLVFIPAAFANLLEGKSFELFVNTASMGEMKNEVIHYWMDLIQNKMKIEKLFTLNRYLNVISGGYACHRIHANECSTSYDNKWKIVNWELEPLYCRCPYIDTLHSRYVQIAATRGVAQEDRSDELLQSALSEDWHRLTTPEYMQARMNVLVNDMTMTGTLFKLWESIRLNQNVANVSAMLEYLGRIIIKDQFEEVYYYQDWLSQQKIA